MLPLNFNHLYYFYIAARRGTISAAAEELRVSQSSISVQIKQFERSLGHKLFRRTKGGVELTESGMLVFQFADNTFHDVGPLTDQLDAIAHHPRGTLAIGTVNSIGIYALPHVLKSFNDTYPDVKVGIHFSSPAELVAMIRRGAIDFAILASSRKYSGLTGVPLRKTKMFLVAPAGHPLGDLGRVSPADLEPYPFIGLEQGSETRGMIDGLFRRMSLSIEYVMESSNVATIKHMVMAGLGVAILPEPVVAPEIRSGQLLRPSIPSLYMFQSITLYYLSNRTLSPTQTEFVEHLKREMGGERPLKR